MRHEEIEEIVARYLALREGDSDLAPEIFAAEYADSADYVVRAIRASLEVLGMMSVGAEDIPGHVGPYRVVREIGRGGMGVVYEVEREGQRHALKILPHAAILGPKPLERFRREAEVMRRLDHRNIVSVSHAGSSEGSPYIVMELVDGEPLSACIGRISIREAAELVRLLAIAVQSAHEQGVLHRDLKPQNVMLRADGSPVLLDFGLVAASDEPSLTSTGDVLGTPRYMAPEQALGRATDERTDVYGLGQVLYEILCGRPAHAQDSRPRILQSVVAGRFPRPRRLRSDVPEGLEKIVLQALARNPERRYASAGDLASDLERCLNGETPLARPPGPLARFAEAIRARPVRSGVVTATLALALVAVWLGVQAREQRAAETRRNLARSLDHAVWAWAQGNEPRARRGANEALGFDSEDPTARALLAHLDGRGGAGGALGAGLEEFARGEYRAAEATFLRASDSHPRSPLAALLLARSLRFSERIDEARVCLERLAAELPESSVVAAELATVYADLGRTEAAEGEFRRAMALNPEDTLLRETLAGVGLEGGVTREAVEEAHRAAAQGVRLGEARVTKLSRILDHAADSEAVREILREMLAEDPDRVDTRFALAASLDTDHLVTDAEAEYRAVLERDPEHTFAMVYLAYLKVGADLDRCQECAGVFSDSPELVDVDEAGRLLAGAARVDRGRDGNLLTSIVEIAKDRGLIEPVLAALEPLLEDGQRTARVMRIESALRRLRQAERE